MAMWSRTPEGFAIDEIFGAEDGISQSSHILLAGVVDFHGSHFPYFPEKMHFARFVKVLFQFRGGIEMVFNGSFGMAGNNEDLLNAAGPDFFYDILDGRFIYNRKHFLGHGLCFRKEAGAEACCRNDCFSDFLHICTPLYVVIALWTRLRTVSRQ